MMEGVVILHETITEACEMILRKLPIYLVKWTSTMIFFKVTHLFFSVQLMNGLM